MVTACGANPLRQPRLAAVLARVVYPFVLSVVGPALFSLAFPPFDLGPIALVALVPLFVLWTSQSWKQAFWWGWFAGTIIFFGILYWTSITIFQFVGPWAPFALLLLCAIEGLAVATTAATAALISRAQFTVWSIFALPAAWLVFEIIRTSGSLGVPFGELGLVAANIAWLLPIASFGGVYLLTVVVALTNAGIAAILSKDGSANKAGVIVLAVLGGIIAITNLSRPQALPPTTVAVAVVQGNIEQDEKWNPKIFEQTQTIYTEMTRSAAKLGASVVIWPETAITTSARQDPSLLRKLEALSASTHTWLIAGTIDTPSTDGYYNALLDLTPHGSVAGVYHKHWLVPFAEYLPFNNLLRRLPVMDNASDFRAGPGPSLLAADGHRWGPMICYESAYATYARATANAGADLLMIATDDAWFSGTPEPYQHADAAVISAVATGRWVVRAASTGISEIIDPNGNVIARLGVGQRGLVFARVGNGFVTAYDHFGIVWLVVLSCVYLAVSLVRVRSGQSIKKAKNNPVAAA